MFMIPVSVPCPIYDRKSYGGGFIAEADGCCYALSCTEGSTCCKNNQGLGYCCASGNICKDQVCAVKDNLCFAGDASVHVNDKGTTALKDLRVGEHVLVKPADADFAYEPVLAFLHSTRVGEANKYM